MTYFSSLFAPFFPTASPTAPKPVDDPARRAERRRLFEANAALEPCFEPNDVAPGSSVEPLVGRVHAWPDPARPEEWSEIDEECAFCSVRVRLRWVDDGASGARRPVAEVSRDGLTWTREAPPARCELEPKA